MAAPTLSDYINKQGKQVRNLQKFISYYGELHQYYSDQGLPESKFIYYLEENTYIDGFSTVPPEIRKFMALRQDQIAFLTPYVRLYKKMTSKGSKPKILEFPSLHLNGNEAPPCMDLRRCSFERGSHG